MSIVLIAAVARNGVIGKDGKLPWHLPADLQHFKALTMGGTVIMGRRTWESIGKPLPGRINIVVTSHSIPQVDCARSLTEAIARAGSSNVFVIGGAKLFAEALPLANRLNITWVDADVDGDVRFPTLDPANWREVESRVREPDEKNPCRLTFAVFERTLSSPVK